MRVLLVSGPSADLHTLLPAMELLDHSVQRAGLDAPSLDEHPAVDLVLLDATRNFGEAATACRRLSGSTAGVPVLVVIADGALAALKLDWGFTDWVVSSANPAEVETRMRLAVQRTGAGERRTEASIGGLSIDEDSYIVRLRGRPLDLTYREFELLKFLAANPRRVFTRGQLLQEVWGYDYFGGTRTVDVHIRRLRAKLGAEYEQLIGTVRGVGYKLDPLGLGQSGRPDEADLAATPPPEGQQADAAAHTEPSGRRGNQPHA